MTRCAASSSLRDSPSKSFASCPLRTAFIGGLNYSIRLYWYMLDPHEHPDGSSASMGRNRPRKSDGDAVAEDRDRRARDARADLSETRLPRADALARERADDLHPAGRAQVPDRRRRDHGSRRRSAAHSIVGRASGGSARRYVRAGPVQSHPPGLARSHRRLFPPMILIIPLIIVALLVAWIISSYNSLVGMP